MFATVVNGEVVCAPTPEEVGREVGRRFSSGVVRHAPLFRGVDFASDEEARRAVRAAAREILSAR